MIEMYHMEIRRKESEKMVREDEMCKCDVRRRMDLGLIPPIPLIRNGFIRVCPWCEKVNPSWAKQQRAEERKEKGAMTREMMMKKVEEAINPMARSGKNFAVSVVGLEKKTEESKPEKRTVWVVVRISKDLEASNICVFDSIDKAEQFHRALSLSGAYDCVTKMYEREVIE